MTTTTPEIPSATSPLDDPALARCAELDARLVAAAKGIRVLAYLDWPPRLRDPFLASWRAGDPEPPKHEYVRLDLSKEVAELKEISYACDRGHPVGKYIYQTARSYMTAATMLESVGTPAFTALSVELYGRPGDRIGKGNLTNVDAADHFLKVSDEFVNAVYLTPEDYSLSPEDVAKGLDQVVRPVFGSDMPAIVVDPDLASMAAAGASRVRIRGNTKFASLDIQQLAQHEVFVHSATMRNGMEQPYLKSLGLGAPRTTRTQEGLATLAELVTSAIDLTRLRRIALRIKAIDLALDGADFLEVFQFFVESGQDEVESYQSAMRVFRGGDPRGGICFTKDGMYVHGLVSAHTFLRKAIQGGKVDYPHYLMAGRLALGDVIAMEPWFRSGFIAGPRIEPPWVANRHCLAAYLCYATFVDRIHLSDVELGDFIGFDR
jgi:uncharacterized protein (TIGR02421 family)